MNRLLSAAWLSRRRHIEDKEVLVHQYGYDPWVADIIVDLVVEEGCSHEELSQTLRESEVCECFVCEEDQRCKICEGGRCSIDLAS